MRIAYLFLPGRLKRLAQLNDAELPTEFFYGALELRKRGHQVDILEIDEGPRRGAIRYLAESLLKKRYLPVKMNPSVLDAVRLQLPALRDYDAVVGTTSGIAFALSFWKTVCRLPFAVVGIINGILNYELNRPRVVFSRFLLKRMAIHLFGEAELEPMRVRYGIPDEEMTVNYFGVDSGFWCDDSSIDSDDGHILAIGNDAMRDFPVLIEAARQIDRKVVIVTRREIPGEIPANVSIAKGSWHSQEISDIVLRDMYRKAFCVVVPLKESFQPSGQSVTLQAMACEKPVILTRTSGLWDATHLVHGHNVLLVDPEMPGQIVACIRQLERGPVDMDKLRKNAKEYVLAHGRIEYFADRLERTICRKEGLTR